MRRTTQPIGGKKNLYFAIAALTCPCHVPIYLAIFGGTAIGAFLSENLWLFILGLTGVFLVTLSRGLKLIKKGGRDFSSPT